MKQIHYDSRGKCDVLVESDQGGDATAFLGFDDGRSENIGENVTAEDLQNLVHDNTGIHIRPAFQNRFDKHVIQSDSSDVATINGLPPQTVVDLEGVGVYEINDGKVILATSDPGDYKLKIDPFPYRPLTETIHAD